MTDQQKTATIPMEWLDALLGVYRAASDGLSKGEDCDGNTIYHFDSASEAKRLAEACISIDKLALKAIKS